MVDLGGHLFCSNGMQSRVGRVGADRILFKQAGDQGRVKTGANTYDQIAFEINEPALPIVKTHPIPGRR